MVEIGTHQVLVLCACNNHATVSMFLKAIPIKDDTYEGKIEMFCSCEHCGRGFPHYTDIDTLFNLCIKYDSEYRFNEPIIITPPMA